MTEPKRPPTIKGPRLVNFVFRHVEDLVATAANGIVARAAVEPAVQPYPNKPVTLRDRPLVVAQHPGAEAAKRARPPVGLNSAPPRAGVGSDGPSNVQRRRAD